MSKTKKFKVSDITRTGLVNFIKKNKTSKFGVASATTCPIAKYIRSKVGPKSIEVQDSHIRIGGELKGTTYSTPNWAFRFIKKFDRSFNSETVRGSRILEIL